MYAGDAGTIWLKPSTNSKTYCLLKDVHQCMRGMKEHGL